MDAIRPWLFIGSYRDALNRRFLKLNSIQAMLHRAEEVDQHDIFCLCLPVEDMEKIPAGMIRSGVKFIKEHAAQKNNILITCGAGINRSTAYCVIALKEIERLGRLMAYKEVKQKHYEALPNKYVWESLWDYYHEAVPYLSVMKAAA